jgi:hypothetical protein
MMNDHTTTRTPQQAMALSSRPSQDDRPVCGLGSSNSPAMKKTNALR